MDITKVCFKCGRELPLSEFYKHHKMADGHLNKCKECTRKDVKENYLDNSKDPAYMEKERERGREKYARLGYRGRVSDEQKLKRRLYPGLRSAKQMLGLKIPRTEELHHWNYNLIRNVIRMPRSLHSRIHSVISLNAEEGIYYHNGEKLDTLDKHMAVVKEVCQEFGFDFSKLIVY